MLNLIIGKQICIQNIHKRMTVDYALKWICVKMWRDSILLYIWRHNNLPAMNNVFVVSIKSDRDSKSHSFFYVFWLFKRKIGLIRFRAWYRCWRFHYNYFIICQWSHRFRKLWWNNKHFILLKARASFLYDLNRALIMSKSMKSFYYINNGKM